MEGVKYIWRMVCVLSLVLLISGCWVPEDFDALVDIKSDGNFTFVYEGTLVFIPLFEEAKAGVDVKDLAEEIKDGLKEDPEFLRVSYEGMGRYKIVYKKNGHLDKAFYFLERDGAIFSINRLSGGVIEIKGFRLKDKDRNKVKQAGIAIDGTLKVKVDGEAIEHNAHSEPKMFGMFGGYEWDIDTDSKEAPYMKVRIKEGHEEKK